VQARTVYRKGKRLALSRRRALAENFREPKRLIRTGCFEKESLLIRHFAGNRPHQPDEFYPKPPPTEPVPEVPIPPETPVPVGPPAGPSPLPEQPLEPEKPVIHPTPPPEVP
jgi:hypothetical protein